MKKGKSKFGLGLALGLVGGLVAAKRLLGTPRMPHAKIWQRILAEKHGEIDAAVFMARVQVRYDELKSRRPIFEHVVLNLQLIIGLLPGLALYQVLCEDGMTRDEALTETDRIFFIWFESTPPLNLHLNQLMAYPPQNFNIFQRLVRFTMDTFFPPPGWEYDVIEENEVTLAFNIHNCFYLKVLTYYQAPELTPVFCKLDDYLMGAMPDSLRWGRTQTIGMGADFCNFRWDKVPFDKE
jgi:hypothetical protein